MATNADLYLRLSIDHERATAIERQEAECRRWCLEHDLTVRRVHVDRGVSGFSTTAHRDGFEAALAAVVTGEVSTLVVWKLDRLSRRGIGQVGQVLDRFEQASGRLVSVMDGLDTTQPQARMIIALLSEFARAESETMGVRIKSAKEAQRARGEWLSGKPPFGYAIAPDRRLCPVEPTASAVRETFQMIIDGSSLVSIARHLNAQGFRSSHGGLWRDSALSEALRSPAYAGFTPVRHVNEKGLHAAGIPDIYRDRETGEAVSCLTAGAKPIVSRATQLAAQAALLTRQQRHPRGTGPRRPAYALLLRGMGRCGGCGHALVTYGGYRRRVLDREGNVVCGEPANAAVGVVDRHVTAAWINLVASSGPEGERLRRAVASRWLATADRPSRNGSGELTTQIAELTARLDDADAARYVHGTLDERRHRQVSVRLRERIETLSVALAGQPPCDTDQLRDHEFVVDRWAGETPDGRRALLRMAWDSVTIAKARVRGRAFTPGRLSYVAC
ncbi:recombinase family protein [uncultured Jatrophihabitans sp.]|uniref:recombinase family protein n=1 Tax=uncultured Jatrophihabitans sp. TaxID=1610747 RepID=UPI0035CA8DE2